MHQHFVQDVKYGARTLRKNRATQSRVAGEARQYPASTVTTARNICLWGSGLKNRSRNAAV